MSDEYLPSRRIVFQGLSALGVAAVLAGCGADPSSTGDATSSKPAGGKKGVVLAKTTEVPVGGGIILPDEKIVITQPTAGEFKAFTAVCTHQGFTVTSVEGAQILCNHHNSVYDAASGKNIGGPAPAPLASIAIRVKGSNILQA
jgi:Rieske Fe-S protein